jgi:hypothetical protein
MNHHLMWDLIAYGCYLLGQFLFLLKRAHSALANKSTAVTSIGSYFKYSWAPIVIRVLLEAPLFYVLRHYPAALTYLVGMWGLTIPASVSLPNNPITSFLAGYAVDSLVDWASVSPKVPAVIRGWLKENVPTLDMAKLSNKPDQGA